MQLLNHKIVYQNCHTKSHGRVEKMFSIFIHRVVHEKIENYSRRVALLVKI